MQQYQWNATLPCIAREGPPPAQWHGVGDHGGGGGDDHGGGGGGGGGDHGGGGGGVRLPLFRLPPLHHREESKSNIFPKMEGKVPTFLMSQQSFF